MDFIDPVYPASILALRNQFCRLCLKKFENFLMPLVDAMEMLLMVTGLELEANPLFPTMICSKCMTKLDLAYNVRQEFLHSAELLLKMSVENKLAEYFTQFGNDSDKDEALRDSMNVKDTIDDLDVSAYSIDKKETQDSVKICLEEKKAIKFQQLECLDYEPADKQPSTDEHIERKCEQFVYSWKDLVKPKTTKKERPKTALTGVNRKSKADAELLAQFPQTTCYICDTSHQSLEERDEHLNVHISMLPHRCETCSTDTDAVISKSVITLNRHRLMHRLPYKCPMCFRRFISSGSQYTHIWSMHMGNSEGLSCDYCGKCFNQKRSFQAHVRRHRYKANGKYRCDICEETCGSSLLLTRHKRKHTGEKNFSCPYCPKSFSRACNLLTHKRIHTNERCHQCDDCGRSFRDTVTLRKHQERFHQGRTPVLKVDRNPFLITQDGRKLFQCKIVDCNYETYNSTSMSRHKARHLKRYACGICGKRFAEPNLVRRHHASMHNDKRKLHNHKEEGHSTHKINDAVENVQNHEDVGQSNQVYTIVPQVDKPFQQKVSKDNKK